MPNLSLTPNPNLIDKKSHSCKFHLNEKFFSARLDEENHKYFFHHNSRFWTVYHRPIKTHKCTDPYQNWTF